MASLEKRKKLREVVFGSRKNWLRSRKICVKIDKTPLLPDIPDEQLHPLLGFELFAPQNYEERETLFRKLKRDLRYAMNRIIKPSDSQISVNAIELCKGTKKVLLLGLEGTLVHTSEDLQHPQVQLSIDNRVLNLNVRPHCLSFLRKMSEHFDIYIFTAWPLEEVKPVVKFLGGKECGIRGILHRGHCLRTKNGRFIKDLRIISNFDVGQLTIVDCDLCSFSFQLDNGILIQEYQSDNQDQVLRKVERILIELSKQKDVTKFLAEKLKLREIMKYNNQNQLFSKHFNLMKQRGLQIQLRHK